MSDILVVHQNLYDARTEWMKPNYTSNTCTLALIESVCMFNVCLNCLTIRLAFLHEDISYRPWECWVGFQGTSCMHICKMFLTDHEFLFYVSSPCHTATNKQGAETHSWSQCSSDIPSPKYMRNLCQPKMWKIYVKSIV